MGDLWEHTQSGSVATVQIAMLVRRYELGLRTINLIPLGVDPVKRFLKMAKAKKSLAKQEQKELEETRITIIDEKKHIEKQKKKETEFQVFKRLFEKYGNKSWLIPVEELEKTSKEFQDLLMNKYIYNG